MEEKKMKKIESFKKSNKGNKKERKPFLQWYDEDRRPLKAKFKAKMPTAVLLLVCVGVMFMIWEFVISDGYFNYSDEIYEGMETVLGEQITEGIGCDIRKIQKKVDLCKFEYNKGKEPILIVGKDLGYFKPVVTVTLNENYRIIDLDRNYGSVEEYLRIYRIRFVAFVFGGGFLVWLVILCFPYLVLYGVKKMLQILQKIKKINLSEEIPPKKEREVTV